MMEYNSYRGRNNGVRRWLIALLALVIIGVLGFTALEVYITLNGRDYLVGEPKVMVIFGCQVKPDGPSILLRDRLDTALDYLKDHPDMKVVVSGGKGDDEHISEAQCMYDYLTAHGVDGANIYMEDKSRNTWQNINYTFALMKDEGWDLGADVLLVSSGFHLSRIRMLWDRVRVGQLGSSGQNICTLAAPCSHAPSRTLMFFREPLALVKSFLLDR